MSLGAEEERSPRGLDGVCDRLDRVLRLGLQLPLDLYLTFFELALEPLYHLLMWGLLGAIAPSGPFEPACRFLVKLDARQRPIVLDRATGHRWWRCPDWLVTPFDWRGKELEREMGPGWRLPTREELYGIVRWDAGGGIGGDMDGAFDGPFGRAVWIQGKAKGSCEVDELRDSTREDFWGRTHGGPDRSETFVLAILPADESSPAETAPVPPVPDPARFVGASGEWLMDRELHLEWLVVSASGIGYFDVQGAVRARSGGWRVPTIPELTGLLASRPQHRELWGKLEKSYLWSVPSDVSGFRLVMDRRDRFAYRVGHSAVACLVLVRAALE